MSSTTMGVCRGGCISCHVARGLPPPEVIEVSHAVTWQDVTASNTFHVLVAGTATAEDLAQVNACLQDWYVNDEGGTRLPPARYTPYSTPELEFLLITVVARLPIPGLSALASYVVETIQAGANVAYPGACALMTWRIARGGRGSKGRSYIGPIRDSLLAGQPEGRLNGLEAAGLSAAWRSLIPRLMSWGPEPGRYRLVLQHSHPMPGSESLSGLWDTIVSGGIEDARLRTQDRRVPRARLPLI